MDSSKAFDNINYELLITKLYTYGFSKDAIMVQLFGIYLVPEKIRHTDSLKRFKSKIRTRKPKNCPCRICKSYICNVGF